MLFAEVSLSAALETHRKRVDRIIIDDQFDLLEEDQDSFASELLNRYRIDSLEIDTSNCYAQVVEQFIYVNIPYSGEPGFMYSGDPKLIEHCPDQYHDRVVPPNIEEEFVDNTIVLKIDTTELDENSLKSTIEDHLDELVDIADQMNDEINSFNDKLSDLINDLIDTKLTAAQQTEELANNANLNMPVRRGKGKKPK